MTRSILTRIFFIYTILSSTAFASSGQFYLKGELGFNRMQDIKISGKKFSQSNVALYGGGLGYYFFNNLRTDLVINYSTPESKYSSNSIPQSNIKAKPKISALFLTGYVDLFDISICEVFIGAGAGVSQIKNKVTMDTVYSNTVPTTQTASNKKNSFAYQLVAGTAIKMTPSMNLELTYSWKDFGSTKEITNFIQSMDYKGHNVTLGLRFDL